VQVLLICLARNQCFIYVNVYTDSQLIFEQVVYDILEGGRRNAVTFLHNSSPVGAIWGRKCSLLLMGGVNSDGVVAITNVKFRPEGVYSNCVSDEGLTGNECRLYFSFLISFD